MTAPRRLAYGGPAGGANLHPRRTLRRAHAYAPRMSDSPTRGFTRQAFLVGAGATVAAVATVGLVGCGESPPPTPSMNQVLEFIGVSKILTGVDVLPHAPAQEYLEGLEAAGLECSPIQFTEVAYKGAGAPGDYQDLVRQGATKLPGADACMRAIASAWWSGAVPLAGGGLKVVSFGDALVWKRVHESSQCLGATGSWSKPGEQGT